MALVCAGCKYSEQQTEKARFCRDCGKPYVYYLGEGLAPVYVDGARIELTVVNDHTLPFIIGELEFPDASIMSKAAVTNGLVPPGSRQTVRFSFDELPPWCRNQAQPVEVPLIIRAGSKSGEPRYEWNFSLICSDEPQLEIQLKSEAIRLCAYSPVKFELDLVCRQGFAIIEAVRVGGETALDLKDAPVTLMGPDGHATIPVLLDHETALRLEGQTETMIELTCRGLAPREVPVTVVTGRTHNYLIRTERWTDQGYRRAFEDAQPVNLDAGLELWVDRKEASRKILYFAMEKGPAPELEATEADPRPLCNIDIRNISVALDGVTVFPEQPIQLARDIERTKTLIIDGHNLQTIESCLQIDFYHHRTEHEIQEVPLRINVFDSGAYPVFLGVDFGTSNSCVALIKPVKNGDIWQVSRFPQHVQNLGLDVVSSRFDPQVMPTVLDLSCPISYDGIGDLAKSRASRSHVKEFKRWINDLDPERRRRGMELAAKFIQELLRRTQSFLLDQGTPFYQPVKVMMTVPTAFNRRERTALKSCCVQALSDRGVENPVVELIDESLAALKYYVNLDDEIKREMPSADLIMVLDCGGGTTDITVVEKFKDRFEPIIAGGDPEFGGKEATYWLEQLFKSDPNHDPYFVGIADQAKRGLTDEQTWDRFLAEYSTHRPPARSYREIVDHIKAQLTEDMERVLRDIIFYLARRPPSNDGNLPKKMLVCLAGGCANLVGFTEVVADILERLFVEFGLDQQVELSNVLIGNEPKKSVSQGAFISANFGSVGIGQGKDFSSFRVVVPVEPGVTLNGVDDVMVKIRPVMQGRDPMIRVAVLLHANLPFPTPDDLIPTLTLKDNFGVCIDKLTPLNLCTQYGSGTPRPLYEQDKVPLIPCDRPFRVYLDRDGEVKVEI